MLGLKPSPPETFPDFQFVGALEPALPTDAEPELIASGYNSSAWRLGDKVVKATMQACDLTGAIRLIDSMRYEDEAQRPFIGDYMPETDYTVALERGTLDAHVITIQPFVKATPLPDFLRDLRKPRDPLLEFLAKSRELFKAKKLMPDIACIEDNFNVLVTTNVLVREDEESAPILVDTTSGKTQRRLGPLWNRLIYAGAVVADKRLRVEHR